MSRQFFCPQPKKASILIVCLWALTILSILAMGLTGMVFQQIRFSAAFLRLSSSLPVARAAVREVFYRRAAQSSPEYDTIEELSSENTAELCEEVSYKYCFADKKEVDGEKTIIDEGALINLNTADAKILERLPGMNRELAEDVVNSGLRPFRSINEVLLVDGMTIEDFRLFKDSVTVYGGGRVNINTASKTVLSALGLDAELVDIIVRCRRENEIEKKDEESGEIKETGDYGFSSTATILDDLRQFASLGLRQEQDILSLLNILDVKSEYLRFNIIPEVNKKPGLHYSVVIHPANRKIASWSEY